MALSQMQLIQSLGEAMAWFEREVAWDVPPTELRHLCGRIGELYAALITNGRMATEVNQKGYDVVSALGERISVKTTAMMGSGGHVTFNTNTLKNVDRVIVLRINTKESEIEVLLNEIISEAVKLMTPDVGGKRALPVSRLAKKPALRSEIKTVNEVSFDGYDIKELENGSIEVDKAGHIISPAKPVLRSLANQLSLPILNANGNPFNTRQLGTLIIKSILELNSNTA